MDEGGWGGGGLIGGDRVRRLIALLPLVHFLTE